MQLDKNTRYIIIYAALHRFLIAKLQADCMVLVTDYLIYAFRTETLGV